MSQQYLPFTVLKLVKKYTTHFSIDSRLSQQYLPFTVLKLNYVLFPFLCYMLSRNSTYRLRY